MKSSGKLLCVIRLIGRSFIPFSFIVMLLSASVVHAIPIEVNFTAQGFSGITSSLPPTDPVTGTIIYEASSTTATINSLTSINLTINGHTYLVSEVGYISPFMGTSQLIGGMLSGVNGVTSNTDDFIIWWRQSTLIPFSFMYTSSLQLGIWSTPNFSQFSVTVSTTPVPEPATMLLLGSGLIGLAGYGRRKFFKK